LQYISLSPIDRQCIYLLNFGNKTEE
jgi:hypothetical protein